MQIRQLLADERTTMKLLLICVDEVKDRNHANDVSSEVVDSCIGLRGVEVVREMRKE
jgi:hypothetical protein